MIVRKFALGIFILILAIAHTPVMHSYATKDRQIDTTQDQQIVFSELSFTPFIPVGSSIRREIGSYTEIIENCDGQTETFLTTPSYPLAADHILEWSYEGITGTTFQLDEQILFLDSDGGSESKTTFIDLNEFTLDEALFETYGELYPHSVRRGNGWLLSAEPDTAVDYTLIWAEIWQPGYVDLKIENRDPIRIQMLYRTDILGEADSASILGCQNSTISNEFDLESREFWINPNDNATYYYIEPGVFTMGSSRSQIESAVQWCNVYFGNCESAWFKDQQPIHRIFTDEYWMMETEVTNLQYQLCVEDGACSIPRNDYWDLPEFAEHPVTNVNWYQATEYATWTGGRLPTEAEWERAARGNEQRIYAWGNHWDASYLNYCDQNCDRRWSDWDNGDLFGDVAPVGTYPKGISPYGLFDMNGNVWEWTADWYDDNYYRQSPTSNPIGPTNGDYRVLRGGSYQHGRWMARATTRYAQDPNSEFDFIGFRVAFDSR